ncbi:MAG: glutamate dehydrogenase, partial [Betaproteobacteria bacterium]
MRVKTVEGFLEEVGRNNPGQSEFLQAVTEVLRSVWPFIERNTRYA